MLCLNESVKKLKNDSIMLIPGERDWEELGRRDFLPKGQGGGLLNPQIDTITLIGAIFKNRVLSGSISLDTQSTKEHHTRGL